MPSRREQVLAVTLFLLTAGTTTFMFGPLYSMPLLLILGAHEMGHYVMCRRYGVAATYPMFLPLPFGFGTLGAVIAIRSMFPNRRALFDMAAAGPLAGFVFAVPISIFGLSRSQPIAMPEEPIPGVVLGDSILFKVLGRLFFGEIPTGHDILLHPAALAGWIGLFITGLNLLPIGQLDGGHVIYAWLGRRLAKTTTRAALVGFALVTVLLYPPWILFLLLAWRFASQHPPTYDDASPLDPMRKRVAALTCAVFVLTFIPMPFLGIPSLLGVIASRF